MGELGVGDICGWVDGGDDLMLLRPLWGEML